MKLVSFVYCQDTQTDPGQGQVMIVSPIQMITPVGFPSNYSFCVSYGLLGKSNEFEGKTLITVFVDPDGKELSKNTLVLPPVPEELASLKSRIGIQVNVAFNNVVLAKAGVYKTIVRLNDRPLKEFPVDVFISDSK